MALGRDFVCCGTAVVKEVEKGQRPNARKNCDAAGRSFSNIYCLYVRACVRPCVRACVRACVCVFVVVYFVCCRFLSILAFE